MKIEKNWNCTSVLFQIWFFIPLSIHLLIYLIICFQYKLSHTIFYAGKSRTALLTKLPQIETLQKHKFQRQQNIRWRAPCVLVKCLHLILADVISKTEELKLNNKINSDQNIYNPIVLSLLPKHASFAFNFTEIKITSLHLWECNLVLSSWTLRLHGSFADSRVFLGKRKTHGFRRLT